MSYLLYCIFRSSPQLEREAVTGVAAQPVLVIEHDGLGGAISELREPDSHPDVASVLAYESVAETFFRQRTIIPMRYGCAVQNRQEFVALLDKHRKECDTLLHRLEGLAEMGIQVSASGREEDDDEICMAAIPQARWRDSNPSGASYLSAKKLYYRGADRKVERQNELAQAVCRPLAGLFVEHKVELPFRARSLLLLYFLVPRSRSTPFARPAAALFRAISKTCASADLGRPITSPPSPTAAGSRKQLISRPRGFLNRLRSQLPNNPTPTTEAGRRYRNLVIG